MQSAIDVVEADRADAGIIRLDAQAHLEPWYARFGFIRDGEGWLEDGIPHVPMTRTLP